MSDEQSALIELGVNMTKQLDELNQRIERLEKISISDVVEAQYMEVFSCVFLI
jgi:hypothetical protein